MEQYLERSKENIRALIANLGLWDYRGKNWDYGITPCLKLGLQKSALKLGLWISNPTKLGFSIHVNWDYGISPYLKFGLWDYTSFEIGVTGLQDLPYGGPNIVEIHPKDKV